MGNATMNDSILITIPARGGSQRLKRKAMRWVCGKPLIWYTIDYAKRLDFPIVVITDDDDFASYAKRCGVDVVKEPPIKEECGSRAIYRAVQQIGCDVVVNLSPTSPVRSVDLVQRCLDALTPDVDSIRSVVPARTRPEWCLELGGDGEIIPAADWDISQNCEQVYELSGCVDVFWARMFLEEPSSFKEFWKGAVVKGVVQDNPYCDIDTREDLILFEFLLRSGRTIWRIGSEYCGSV